MNFRNIVVLTLLTVLFNEAASGQGKLIFLNGKEKRFSTAEVKGEYIVYQPEGSSKTWSRKADKYNVFSILKDDGTEEIIYVPDTSEEAGDPTIVEVRDYINGEKHAAAVYNEPANKFVAFEIGLLSSVAGFYGIPIPIIYSTVIGNINPKLPRNERNNNYSEAYIAGYKKKARNMKIRSSLLGGAVGFGVGITTLILVLGND